MSNLKVLLNKLQASRNPVRLLFLGFLTLSLSACSDSMRQKPIESAGSQVTEVEQESSFIEITDSRGKVQFNRPPTKVVTLNWTLTEQLLDLDIVPIAAAEADLYRTKTGRPELPEQVIDIGPRNQPNLVQISQLKPDFILIGSDQKHLSRRLINIAPIVYFKNFSHRYNNAERARHIYLELARLFNRSALAQARLKSMDKSLSELSNELTTLFNGNKPHIALIVPDDQKDSKLWIFSNNSMVDHALNRVGLQNLYNAEATKFGFERMDASRIPEGKTCYLIAGEKRDRQLPFLNKADCVAHIPETTSFYGGVKSLQRLAEVISIGLRDANT